jgi:LysM repeat protein
MHEYMLVNKSTEYTARMPTLVELTPLEYAGEKENDETKSPVTGYDDYYDPVAEKFEGRFSMAGPRGKEVEENIRRREESKARRRGSATEQKRAMNLLAGLCAVLFVVSFIMGVGLIRSQDRLDNNEAQIRQLTTALRNFMASEITLEHTPVFAEAETQESIVANEIPVAGTQMTTEEIQTRNDEVIFENVNPYSSGTAADTSAATIINTPHEETALVPPLPETYTIQPGDSLLAISLEFFGDANMVSEILALNGLDNPDLIIAGRTIMLPPRR